MCTACCTLISPPAGEDGLLALVDVGGRAAASELPCVLLSGLHRASLLVDVLPGSKASMPCSCWVCTRVKSRVGFAAADLVAKAVGPQHLSKRQMWDTFMALDQAHACRLRPACTPMAPVGITLLPLPSPPLNVRAWKCTYRDSVAQLHATAVGWCMRYHCCCCRFVPALQRVQCQSAACR